MLASVGFRARLKARTNPGCIYSPDQPNGRETNIMEDGGLVQMMFLCKGVIFRCFQGSTSEAPEVNPKE